MDSFYNGRMPDPLQWLLYNNVRYVMWLSRDNADANARFTPLFEKLKGHYFWHQMYGTEPHYAIGFCDQFEVSKSH